MLLFFFLGLGLDVLLVIIGMEFEDCAFFWVCTPGGRGGGGGFWRRGQLGGREIDELFLFPLLLVQFV